MVIRSPHTTHRPNGFPFDLASWLHEQLENDRQIAVAAGVDLGMSRLGADDRKRFADALMRWVCRPFLFSRRVDADLSGHDVTVTADALGPVSDHIARHDPARVLDEIKAKELLLDEAVRALFDDVTDETAQWTLRVLALPYTQYPGFQETWRLSYRRS